MRAIPLLTVGLLLCACGSLPDLEGYADATAAVTEAVATAEGAMAEDLELLASLDPGDDDYAGYVRRFREAWSARLAALRAMTAYTDSLAQIVAAARESEQSVRALSDELSDLVQTVTPANPVSEVDRDLAVKLASAVQTLRAMSTLKAVIPEADPIVGEVASRLRSDLQVLAQLLEPDDLELTVLTKVRRSIERKHGMTVSYRREMLAARETLREELSKRLRLSEQALMAITVEQRLREQDKLTAELDRLERLIGQTEAMHRELTETTGDLRQRFSAQRAIVARAVIAIDAWREGHAQLARSMEEGGARPTFRVLLGTAYEIRAILRRTE